ncbi:hypothetical protein I6H08_37685 (plasmid) [Burkholderia gladioli]|uniref:hypothetical protein n=1 Tax=Burkholderia gladioli TaxID=28095 RepID=UPI0019373318|nr:hypothetical protein [Burkholderia gladioli]QPQ88817.1 hypothetical protein I6H08_37685 [Burkholderia gladioli]
MPRKIRESKNNQLESTNLKNIKDQVGIYKDLLDAILKTGAVSLPIPAILIFNYLKLIGHSDLFAPSVLSLAGLSALLQFFLLLWVAFIVSIITPSCFVCMFLGGTSHKRPARGIPKMVLYSSVIWGAFYSGAAYYGDKAGPLTWSYWVPFFGILISICIIIAVIAWNSKSIVPDLELRRGHFSRPTNKWTAHVADLFRKISARRLWRSACVSAAISFSGLYAVYSIHTISVFSGMMHLPRHGLKASLIVFFVIIFAFLPGAVYLKVRSTNGSHGKSLKLATLVTFAFTYIALLNGLSAEPIALAAMKGMAIIDNTERTYEVVKSEERPIYRALGYRPKAGDQFVQAYIRFQFADIKLVCPKKNPLLDITSEIYSDSPQTPPTTPLQHKSIKTSIDSEGCLVPLRDEVRVVDLPIGFSLRPHA